MEEDSRGCSIAASTRCQSASLRSRRREIAGFLSEFDTLFAERYPLLDALVASTWQPNNPAASGCPIYGVAELRASTLAPATSVAETRVTFILNTLRQRRILINT